MKNVPWIYRLSLPMRLMALLFVPVMLLSLLIVEDGSLAYRNYIDFEHTAEQVKVSIKSSALIHEMQKERGMSAKWMGSGNVQAYADLTKQRAAVDVKLKELVAFTGRVELSAEKNAHLLKSLKALGNLKQQRENVTKRAGNLADAIGYYSGVIDSLAQDMYGVVARIKDADLKTQMLSYIFMIELKEASGLERAVTANIIAKGLREDTLYQKAQTLIARQDTLLQQLTDLAQPETAAAVKTMMTSENYGNVLQIRSLVRKDDMQNLSKQGDFWWVESTARINSMKVIEDSVANKMLLMASDAFSTFASLIALIALALVSAAFMTYLVTTSIMKPVNGFTEACLSTVGDMETVSTVVVRAYKGMLDTCDDNKRKGDEVANNSEQIAMNIKMIAAAAEELQASVTSTSTKVAQSARVSEDAIAKSEKAMQSVATLNEMSVSIGDIILLINDVADRTNLLALNAAIEAARAGDSGKGFAVVADEVKKLSQNTMDATEEISAKVKAIRSMTSEVGGDITQVMEVIKEIGASSKAFRVSIEEQMLAVQSITHNMVEAREKLEGNNSNVQMMTVGLGMTQSAAEQVKQQIDVLERNTDTISEQIGTFLTRVGAPSLGYSPA